MRKTDFRNWLMVATSFLMFVEQLQNVHTAHSSGADCWTFSVITWPFSISRRSFVTLFGDSRDQSPMKKAPPRAITSEPASIVPLLSTVDPSKFISDVTKRSANCPMVFIMVFACDVSFPIATIDVGTVPFLIDARLSSKLNFKFL